MISWMNSTLKIRALLILGVSFYVANYIVWRFTDGDRAAAESIVANVSISVLSTL